MKTLIQAVAMFIAAATVFAPAVSAYAAKASVYTGRFSNVAVQGYDVVAYFTDAAPVKGKTDFTTRYLGAEFRFVSQANLDAFLADPAAYAPQYGGYCAWAVSQGYTARGSAKHWKIVDDKLYLNYDAAVQEEWETDIPGFIAAADENWPGVLED
ncbi:MAG: YHS domain-containing (seleno)protein [Pseudomonadota bacterium]